MVSEKRIPSLIPPKCKTCGEYLILVNDLLIHPDTLCQEEDGISLEITDEFIYNKYLTTYSFDYTYQEWIKRIEKILNNPIVKFIFKYTKK